MIGTAETFLAIYDRPFERGKGLTDLSKGERAFRKAFGTTKELLGTSTALWDDRNGPAVEHIEVGAPAFSDRVPARAWGCKRRGRPGASAGRASSAVHVHARAHRR